MGKTFMLMAGGTGGHIFPALAVAQSLQARGHSVVWLGSADSMEERIVPQHGIPLETLAIKGVRGNGLKRKLLLPFTLFQTIRAARAAIRKHNVSCVIGFGGFVTFPGGAAAKLCGVPVVIHEQNAVAGLSNRLLAKIATRVLYAFPAAFDAPDGLVGNPVRADIAALPAPEERFAGREGRLKILVVGGSLGAQVLNETVPAALAGALADPGNPHLVFDLLGVLKAEYLDRVYIQPTDELATADEVVAFADSVGAIATYAYLGDVSASPTGDKKAEKFEDDFLDELFDAMEAKGLRAVTYMPPRNTPAQLERVHRLAAAHGMLEISGVDINQPRQAFNCPELRRPEFAGLNEATWALVAHEALSSVDPALHLLGRTGRLGPDRLAQRIAQYAPLGRRIADGEAADRVAEDATRA